MKRKILFVLAGTIISIIFLAACKKNDDHNAGEDARIMMVNASPGQSVAADFYFNDARLNTQSLNYLSNSGYVSLKPGNYTVKVAQVNTINPIADGSYGFSSGKSYSVFAYDTLLAGKVKVFAAEDDLSAPASGKAKIRFFHLSPVSLPVDILANDSIIFANRTYADNVNNGAKANFITVDAGVYTLKVRLAGSADGIPALLTLNNVSFSNGAIYSIFAKGTVNGTGVNALGVEVITNK